MPKPLSARKLGFAEVFTVMQVGAVGKLRGGNLLSSIEFDGPKPQISCAPAGNEDFAPVK
jgi:hypothetical protein